MLEKWMMLKQKEREIKEERIALEESIFMKYGNAVQNKSTTIRDGDFKISIKLNEKLKVAKGITPPAYATDIYTMKVDEKKLEKYADENWVEKVMNKPSIDIVKEV
jgi:hypothetical protein